MTPKRDNGASEQELIENVLGVIKRRLAAIGAASEAELHDPEFVNRRFGEMAADLRLAHDTIRELTSQLYGSDDNPIPVELRHAMRSRGGRAQPVRLVIGGVQRTVLVPPYGHEDPVHEARLWRQLQTRYGEGGR